ncbi:MAG TPA: phosphomannomutase/phosphoglucomutase [Oligoflexia bacterium]|nr:phosphomannomutase/phosphoglucomutase [Oligoflexia bacterium]
MSFKELQNGSDIRGVALDGIPGEEVNLTSARARALGAAFTRWLSTKLNKSPAGLRIALGMDSRISGPVLKTAVLDGITGCGANAADCALATTPAMFMTCVTSGFSFDASIMLTASHLPWNRNGMKFFTKSGGLDKTDITQILALAESGDFAPAPVKGQVESLDFMPVYAAMFTRMIRAANGNVEQPLAGLRIVVDAGNGAGGFYASQVLAPLGADTAGSQFLEPDGSFPNHAPNPENSEAMAAICRAVTAAQADLGIIFDTDVDRAAAVDAGGKPINRNRLIALAAAIVLEEHPKTAIVTDSITSDGLTTFIEQTLGGRHHRFKRGYKNVINEALRLNAAGEECWLAIETSGHAALKENYFLDDGAYLVTKILVKLAQLRRSGKSLGSLLATLAESAESKEFRIAINATDFRAYGERVLHELPAFAGVQPHWRLVPKNFEGVRVSVPGGWFLLRLSLHDPVMPLNIESDAAGGATAVYEQLRGFLSAYEHLVLP